MSPELAIRCIGIGHLLQPPLTLLLARRLRLRSAFESLSPIAYQVAQNMAVAAVVLPTSIGVFIALYAAETLRFGSIWTLALGDALFWTWRLERQIRALGPLFGRIRLWHGVLLTIFVVEGPLFGGLLVAARLGGLQ